MSEKDKELELEASKRQLDEAAAHLRILQAKAEKRHADATIAEITGLSSVQRGIRGKWEEWKRADLESWEQLKGAIRLGIDKLSKSMDSTSRRLDRLDEANDRRIDAELDQIEGAVEVLTARLGAEWVADKKAGADASQALKQAWANLLAKRRSLKGKTGDDAAKSREELQTGHRCATSSLHRAGG
jgi:hypothetical protein